MGERIKRMDEQGQIQNRVTSAFRLFAHFSGSVTLSITPHAAALHLHSLNYHVSYAPLLRPSLQEKGTAKRSDMALGFIPNAFSYPEAPVWDGHRECVTKTLWGLNGGQEWKGCTEICISSYRRIVLFIRSCLSFCSWAFYSIFLLFYSNPIHAHLFTAFSTPAPQAYPSYFSLVFLAHLSISPFLSRFSWCLLINCAICLNFFFLTSSSSSGISVTVSSFLPETIVPFLIFHSSLRFFLSIQFWYLLHSIFKSLLLSLFSSLFLNSTSSFISSISPLDSVPSLSPFSLLHSFLLSLLSLHNFFPSFTLSFLMSSSSSLFSSWLLFSLFFYFY